VKSVKKCEKNGEKSAKNAKKVRKMQKKVQKSAKIAKCECKEKTESKFALHCVALLLQKNRIFAFFHIAFALRYHPWCTVPMFTVRCPSILGKI
jgi:hypothetical protein